MNEKEQIQAAFLIGRAMGLVSSIESGTLNTLRNRLIDENKAAAMKHLSEAHELLKK